MPTPTSTPLRLAVAPVIVAAIAYLLLLFGDQFLIDGPIDRATFGWAVVVPLWCAAPAFGGFAWRNYTPPTWTRAATFAGLVVGGVAGLLIWQEVALPGVGCTPSRTPLELILPALGVGAAIGAAFGLACRVASGEIAVAHNGRGVIYGAVIQALIVPIASWLFLFAFIGLCDRP